MMTKQVHLLSVKVSAWILLILGVAVPIVAQLEGKKVPDWFFVPIFAGMFAAGVSEVLSSFHQRISRLESHSEGQLDESADNPHES